MKYDSELVSPAGIERLIEDLGFGAKLIENSAVTDGKLELAVSEKATTVISKKFP